MMDESQPLLMSMTSGSSRRQSRNASYQTTNHEDLIETLDRTEQSRGSESLTSFGLNVSTEELSIWERSVRFVHDHFSQGVLHKTLGIVLVMCAGFSFTSSNVMQKFSVKELTFWQLLGNRAIIQFIGLGVICVVSHVRRMCRRASYERTLQEDDFDWTDMILGPRGVRKRVVLQGMLGGVLLACMFVAVKFVPLGEASAIMFCTPIFTFIMAPCMLSGERMGVYRIVLTTLMATGVLFITRPDTIFGPPAPFGNSTADGNSTKTLFVLTGGPALAVDQFSHRQWTHWEQVVGYVCCVAVPMLSAFISLVTRQCNVAQTPVHVLMFWFGVGALAVVTTATGTLHIFDTLFDLTIHQLIITTLITVLGIFGNMCYTVAVKFVSPSLANVFRSFEVILNFTLQVKLQGYPAYAINFVGIALLLTAVCMMSYENKAQAKWRRKFKYL